MQLDADVLIVGAGPTGLMMACQLARFGVSFRIIDKQVDRAKESRAFAIQARSMEILQNLGIASQFLKREIVGTGADFYFRGKLKFELDFRNIEIQDTPFPAIFFLPQSETEQILLEYLEKSQHPVERQTELVSFIQMNDIVEADIKNNHTGTNEKVRCRYIVGCDGAHSKVRELLGIPFVGASYQQKFILADVSINLPFPKDKLSFFMNKNGILLSIPLNKQSSLNRLIIADMRDASKPSDDKPLTIEAIENMSKRITEVDLQLSNPIWMSPFFLHHRVVKQYQKDCAFIAGDAAHIHSPVGGQGMNTGLQDACNLAWKMALHVKYGAPQQLLASYQTERQRIGEVLLHSTDKIFGLIVKRNFFTSLLRQYVMPTVMSLLVKSKKWKNYLFHFISELGIHYHENSFIAEQIQGADAKFLAGPCAGCRAPDAPVDNTTLFELFQKKPINILLFQSQDYFELDSKIQILQKVRPEIIAVHRFLKSDSLHVFFERYGISTAGVYCIRPDGYIGFRAFGEELDSLLKYLEKFFTVRLD